MLFKYQKQQQILKSENKQTNNEQRKKNIDSSQACG
jgi:hypothetical protein